MLLLIVVCVALLVTGCAKKKSIQAVEDLNKAFGDAEGRQEVEEGPEQGGGRLAGGAEAAHRDRSGP
jgi:hypothetical protein